MRAGPLFDLVWSQPRQWHITDFTGSHRARHRPGTLLGGHAAPAPKLVRVSRRSTSSGAPVDPEASGDRRLRVSHVR